MEESHIFSEERYLDIESDPCPSPMLLEFAEKSSLGCRWSLRRRCDGPRWVADDPFTAAECDDLLQLYAHLPDMCATHFCAGCAAGAACGCRKRL